MRGVRRNGELRRPAGGPSCRRAATTPPDARRLSRGEHRSPRPLRAHSSPRAQPVRPAQSRRRVGAERARRAGLPDHDRTISRRGRGRALRSRRRARRDPGPAAKGRARRDRHQHRALPKAPDVVRRTHAPGHVGPVRHRAARVLGRRPRAAHHLARGELRGLGAHALRRLASLHHLAHARRHRPGPRKSTSRSNRGGRGSSTSGGRSTPGTPTIARSRRKRARASDTSRCCSPRRSSAATSRSPAWARSWKSSSACSRRSSDRAPGAAARAKIPANSRFPTLLVLRRSPWPSHNDEG